jgi:hypothetical protein
LEPLHGKGPAMRQAELLQGLWLMKFAEAYGRRCRGGSGRAAAAEILCISE